MQLADSVVNSILFIVDDRSKLSTTKKLVNMVNSVLDTELN